MQNTQTSFFHPEQLIPLVHAQHPDRRDVIRALQLSNAGHWENARDVSFVKDSASSDSTREELVIENANHEKMALHFLSDGRIGRIRFY